MDVLAVVLSSSVVSGVVSACVAGWFGVRSRRDEYANEYYKLVIERRLKAYETLENLIMSLKTAVVDEDRKPYHMLFSKDGDLANVYLRLHSTTLISLWLSEELFQATRELNLLIYSQAKDAELIAFGKDNYQTIATLRAKLEQFHARDMLSLHDVPAFLKSKQPESGFSPLPPVAS